jgi:hypothetical protein
MRGKNRIFIRKRGGRKENFTVAANETGYILERQCGC